jgi:hypothetical protein
VVATENGIAVLEFAVTFTTALNTVVLLVNANEFVNPNVVALTTSRRARDERPVLNI